MRKTVSTLLGHAHVEMALSCLGSLLRYSADPLRLRVHDDGSLTPEDRERLAEGLENPEVIPRREADARVEPTLGAACRAFRRENPLALKLFDAAVFAGDDLAFCDSDVLFLRPFSGLFAVEPVFMADQQNAYSIRSWHLALHRRLALPRRVNSGVFQVRTGLYDPDLLEWYLGRPEFRFAPVWVEQTAWALLAGRGGCRLYDPGQIAFPGSAADPVALHFVSPLRSLLAPALEQSRDRRGEPAVAIDTQEAGRCGVLDLALTEARRKLRR
ncbi:MAG TPA: hypothetical protein VG477_09735 [Thermoanaerobaculia bacterium]|nr:hypothetical protein [Thermoanaerobaculia bacterium]